MKDKTSSMPSITKGCGTWHYMAPEVSRGERYGRSSDIWSFGCVVVELSTGHPPYHELEGPQATFKVAEEEAIHQGYSLSERAPEDLQMLLLKIFQYDRRQRSTARQLLEEDPYVNDVTAWHTTKPRKHYH
ncbi:mitogen-activated protein kinase kinase kinase 3-like [Gigantopelta aegis]|uniref:mitogen-activated protein kinase kinase kinase 3-like n=1 Tax=Gigantopelta aegis TaxID=1735272 RepID=UPI001B8875D7|nr:mitogen-activated protein kinase kinase kinase 3-like [Gigantopelta aegis]